MIEIMKETGAIDYCKKTAVNCNEEAKAILRKMNLDLSYSLIFSEMAEFMLNRNY